MYSSQDGHWSMPIEINFQYPIDKASYEIWWTIVLAVISEENIYK